MSNMRREYLKLVLEQVDGLLCATPLAAQQLSV
jgi:hypothetical protein